MAKKNFDLKLKGYVGGWNFDADYVEYILNKCKDKEVNICIDSLGGAVKTALSVSALFKLHGNVNVHYIGMNASAATIASMGAKHISIDKNAMYLVHKCSNIIFEWDQMNADQLKEHIAKLQKTANDLEKIDANIVSLYADRCCKKDKKGNYIGKTPEELMNLMKVGGWLSAQDALDWGFVDEITDEEEQATVLTQETITAMAAAGIPIPEQSKEQREQAKTNLLTAIQQLFGFQPIQAVAEPETKEQKDDTEGNHTPNNQPNNNTPIMKKIYLMVAAVLAVASTEFAANDKGNFELTEANMDALEAKLKENEDAAKAAQEAATKAEADHKAAIDAKDTRIAELEAQIAELNKQPGDETAQVHGQQAGAEKSSAEAQAWKEAEDWFKKRK